MLNRFFLSSTSTFPLWNGFGNISIPCSLGQYWLSGIETILTALMDDVMANEWAEWQVGSTTGAHRSLNAFEIQLIMDGKLDLFLFRVAISFCPFVLLSVVCIFCRHFFSLSKMEKSSLKCAWLPNLHHLFAIFESRILKSVKFGMHVLYIKEGLKSMQVPVWCSG